MKCYWLGLLLAVSCGTISAQQPDPCAGLSGPALDQCHADPQKLQRQQLAQQQQQLSQQQQQLAEQLQQLTQQQQQLAQQQQQLMQQQEQLARQQQEFGQQQKQQQQQAAVARTAEPPASADAKRQELESWKAENPWYGSDYARTQLAMRYARELQREQPGLTGRPFLDALSAKVRDTFGK